MPAPIHPCHTCGEPATRLAHVHHDARCNSCHYWEGQAAYDAQPGYNRFPAVRVDGHHYRVGVSDPTDASRYRGPLDGQRFLVRWADGRTVETTNLMPQGRIPARFRELLPDNADLIEMPAGFVRPGAA